MAETSNIPSQRVLDDIITRAVRFLSNAGTNQVVLTTLRKHGFSPEEQDTG